MDEGLLSLKWNNHKSTFFHILGVLREKQTYTDVTLACEGKLYPAHKFVLSTCSEYFNEIFNSTSGNSVVIVLKDVRRQDLEYLLDYMYLGEVDVAQTELASLIKTAECLRIKGLAIPDDEPPRTSRKVTNDGHERGQSPPTKKRRRPSEEDRQRTGSVNSTNSSSSRVSQGGPSIANNCQTHTTPSSSPSRTAVQSSPSGGASPQLQAASSSLNTATTTTSTFTTPTSLPLASPPHAPVIKQEVAEPPEVPEVYLNEHYEENETKPDLLDQGAQGEHSLAIAGPSGIQGSLGGWDGEGEGAGYSGEGYSEDPNDPEGQGLGEEDVKLEADEEPPWTSTAPSGPCPRYQESASHHRENLMTFGVSPLPSAFPPLGGVGRSVPPITVASGFMGVPLAQPLPPPPPPSVAFSSATMNSRRVGMTAPLTSSSEGSRNVDGGAEGGDDDVRDSCSIIGGPDSDVIGGKEKGGGGGVVMLSSDLKPRRPSLIPPKHKIQPDPSTRTCPTCHKFFPRPSALAIHMRIHTGELVFPCLLCPYKSAQKGNLKRHLKTMHKDVDLSDFLDRFV